jgi:hypothetical protein
MESAEISRSQDLAAAIALPPASNIIFRPSNIIAFPFYFQEKCVWGLLTKKSPEPHPRLEGSGEEKILLLTYEEQLPHGSLS